MLAEELLNLLILKDNFTGKQKKKKTPGRQASTGIKRK
jgi:hypothetical protein